MFKFIINNPIYERKKEPFLFYITPFIQKCIIRGPREKKVWTYLEIGIPGKYISFRIKTKEMEEYK